MVIFLLSVIAVGVLLLSEPGRAILWLLIYLASVLVIFVIMAVAVLAAIAATGLAIWWAVTQLMELEGTIGVLLAFGLCVLLLFALLLLEDRWHSRRISVYEATEAKRENPS